MHADVVAYKANGNRHILDLQMLMRPIGSVDGYVWTDIYGFAKDKVLAHLQKTDVGKWATRNGTSIILTHLRH